MANPTFKPVYGWPSSKKQKAKKRYESRQNATDFGFRDTTPMLKIKYHGS